MTFNVVVVVVDFVGVATLPDYYCVLLLIERDVRLCINTHKAIEFIPKYDL